MAAEANERPWTRTPAINLVWKTKMKQDMEVTHHASPRGPKDYCSKSSSRRFVGTLPFLLASVGFAAVPAMPILFLFWLMRPTVLPNPGMSAHIAPPATRLEPPPKTDLLESEEPSDLILLSNTARNYGRPYAAHDDLTHDYAQRGETERPAKRQTRLSDAKGSRLVEGQ
jgi:hypothetical protein